MKNNFDKYYQAVQYLESIQNLPQADYFVKKTGRSIFLKRLNYFLNLIGNPHQGLKYIHIGGTSGKGSVANMIQSILVETGYKTGLYTSPYPTTSIEKIKVNNQLIDPAEFTRIVDDLKPAIDKTYQKSPLGRPSYFEIFTTIAFIYFKKQKCDYVILEVGLGGRHDATNIIPAPKITVINKIDYDHTEILGKTLREIALEKAAIIKPKTIFFTTSQNNKKVLEIFKKACQKNQAEFNLIKPPKIKYQLSLLGQHQQNNAELAAQVCRKLNAHETKIKTGLKKVKLSCRMEIIKRKPMVILDGAHNVSKIKTTVEAIKNLTYQKLYTIIALTNERNGNQIFKELEKISDYLFITKFNSHHRKCYPPLKLVKKLKTNKPTEIFLDPQMALAKALKLASKDDLILVTGSFYLAGELRKHWRPEEKILKEKKI